MPGPALTPETPFHIVFNPASGKGNAEDARRQMEQVLEQAGRRFQFYTVDDPKQLTAIARRAADAAVSINGAIVAAGGDGTINAVASAALSHRRPFGIIPQGTFNYSSRAHGIPLNTVEATRVLVDGRVTPVQVGAVNDRIFLVNASLGLYPELLQEREQLKRQYGRKRSVALWAGLQTIARGGHRQLVIEIDHDHQKEVVRTPSLFVGNNLLQLEQVGIEDADDVRRNLLVAVIVRPVGMPRLLWLAVRGMLGQLGDDRNIREFSFRVLRVRPLGGMARRQVKVAADGEIFWMRPPLEFRVALDPLMLIVPASEPAHAP